ncbi:MAG TPA: FGGY-family carbohydrate kinase, partial [Aggregatilineales bacterium]|nr:FGGY-family carbohydrate kinase [Aggregatilineales bacterium]
IQYMPLDSMLRAAADIAPGSENLIFHPYLNGERTPHMDSRLTGTFSGLSGEHQSGHFTRAVLEGVAFAMRDCLETLHEIGAYPERMVFSGGGSKIELWGRIFASVLNTRLVTFRHSEQTALGAAMLAALSADQFQDEAEAAAAWVQQGDTIEPVAEWVPIYEERYAVY